MTPDRIKRVKELFERALERDSEDRAAFVSAECADDEELREEVVSLLRFHSSGEQFIDRPVLDLAGLAHSRSLPDAGRRIERYTVLSRIGAGGMGEVFLAEDSALGRKVALKLLPESFASDAERLARFKREARAASALNHPSIITVHEIGSADGVYFIATEFVDGETLRQRLARGPLAPREVLDVAIGIAEALVAAHEAGIVHRDVKPENVMVRRDGYVKVLDFGLAKLSDPTVAASTLTTEPGRILGTVAYMSPEQLHALDVDARTDIWSLGVVLFELATGTRPFVAPTPVGVVTAILERDVPPIAGAVPEGIERIVRKALAKERDERYRTASEMLDDLKAVRADLEFEARVARDSGGRPAAPRPAAAVRRLLSRPRAAWGALAVAAVAVAATVGYLLSSPAAPEKPDEGPIRSIAVLPFSPLSLDERNESLELGMADTLITRLSGLRQLDVRPISAVRAYAKPDRDPLAAGRELKVEAVLDGSIQQAGERLRVSLRLLRVRDANVLWTAALDEKAADIFAVQDAISGRVADSLRIELSGEEQRRLAKRDTESSEAYRCYLKGRYFLDRRGAEWRRKSVEQFAKAVEIDPVYAPAYAGLADAYYEMSYWGDRAPRDYMPKAKAAALKALEIDETLSDAHTALAIVLEDYDWKFADAEREYRRAIELNPRYALAHQRLGQLLAEMGRFEESRAEQQLALEIDPLSLNVNMSIASLRYLSRDVDGAIEQLKRTLELDPTYGEATGLLGWLYVQKGEHDKGVELWLGQMNPGAARAMRGYYEKGGIRGYIEKDVEFAKARTGRDEPFPIFTAMEMAWLGQKDEAFDALERTYQERHSWLGELKVEPAWDNLRSDPRFADLVRRVGLEP